MFEKSERQKARDMLIRAVQQQLQAGRLTQLTQTQALRPMNNIFCVQLWVRFLSAFERDLLLIVEREERKRSGVLVGLSCWEEPT